MRQLLAVSACLLFVAGCGGGGGGSTNPPTVSPPPPPPTAVSASEQLKIDLDGLDLDTFYADSYSALTYRSPEGVIWAALTSLYPLDSAELDDVSDDYRLETIAMHEVVLELLQTYDRASLQADEQLTLELYEWYLQDIVDSGDFFYYDFIATYNFSGIQSSTERFFSDIHPLATEQDALDYISRLNAVLAKFNQIGEYLSMQSAAGVVEPRITLDAAIGRTTGIANSLATNTIFYTAFSDKLNDIATLSDARRQELRDQALVAVNSSVKPAYQNLSSTLTNLQASAPNRIGVGQYPSGAGYYNYTCATTRRQT